MCNKAGWGGELLYSDDATLRKYRIQLLRTIRQRRTRFAPWLCTILKAYARKSLETNKSPLPHGYTSENPASEYPHPDLFDFTEPSSRSNMSLIDKNFIHSLSLNFQIEKRGNQVSGVNPGDTRIRRGSLLTALIRQLTP
jgi:hypothetical protein